MINSDYKNTNFNGFTAIIAVVLILIVGVVAFVILAPDTVSNLTMKLTGQNQGVYGPTTDDPHHQDHLFANGAEQKDASPPPFTSDKNLNSSNYR